MATISPAVYCGTYAKYNSGSIAGQWIDLTEFDDVDEFVAACVALHKDEADPELMYQDWECIPSQYIGESWLDPEIWDYFRAIKESGLDSEVFAAGLELGLPLTDVEEMYQGRYDSDEDFAYQMADDLGMLDDSAQWPHSCIDWERAARDLMYDYCESGCHYFRTSY